MKSKIIKVFTLIAVIITIIFGGNALIKKAYPLNHFQYIKQYSEQYKLDPYLVAAVIKSESNFYVYAKSNRDAHGLMQITDKTGVWIAEQMKISNFDVQDLYKPEINIKMGCWYLDNLRQEFKGNLELMLAAYNAGRGNVNNWLQNPGNSKDGENLQYIPFKETDKYIKRVKVSYNVYKFIYDNR